SCLRMLILNLPAYEFVLINEHMKKHCQNRREFLKKSGLLSSGFLLESTFHILDKHALRRDIVTLGVIGTGSRGLGLIKIIKNIPQLKVVACCDILPWRLEQCKKITDPDTKFYDNYGLLLDDKTIDAVIISTPLFSHYEI